MNSLESIIFNIFNAYKTNNKTLIEKIDPVIRNKQFISIDGSSVSFDIFLRILSGLISLDEKEKREFDLIKDQNESLWKRLNELERFKI